MSKFFFVFFFYMFWPGVLPIPQSDLHTKNILVDSQLIYRYKTIYVTESLHILKWPPETKMQRIMGNVVWQASYRSCWSR